MQAPGAGVDDRRRAALALSVEAADGSPLRLAQDGEALGRAARFTVRKRRRRLIVYTPARA